MTTPSNTATRVTVSGAEIVRLTGVGRERLRTWERRHDFPTPARCPNNVRRYYADDVPRVIVVSRLVEQGVPLADAIEQAAAMSDVSSELGSLGPVLDHAPIPAVALCGGGDALRVVWANGAARARAVPPNLGEPAMEALPELEADAWTQLRKLMSGESSTAEVLGESITGRHWLAWRIPHEVNSNPTVVLVHVVSGELEPHAALQHATPNSSDELNGEAEWALAVRAARTVLGTESGPVAAQRALAALVNQLDGVDAFLSTCQSGRLRSASSVRGTIAATSVMLEPEFDIRQWIRTSEVEWVGPSSREHLGIPPHLQAVCVPITVQGSPCGAAFIVLQTDRPLGTGARELLSMFGTVLGAALARR